MTARLLGAALAALLVAGALLGTIRYATADRQLKRPTTDPGLRSLLVGRELWWVRSSLRAAGVEVRVSSRSSSRGGLWAQVTSLGALHERSGRRVVALEIKPSVRPPLQIDQRAARSQCASARPRLRSFYDQPLFGGPRAYLGGFIQHGALTYLSAGRAGGAFMQMVVPSRVPSGSFLVRGSRVDGPGSIRFEQRSISGSDGIPLVGTPHELHLPADHGLRVWGFILHFPAPGCYALQIDGHTFSQVIAFRAARTRPERLPRGQR